MIIDIVIPSPGESITEVELARWFVSNGELVSRDQEIAEVESDKATLPLIAEKSGKINILVDAGKTVQVHTVACTIDTSYKGEVKNKGKDSPEVRTKEKSSEKSGADVKTISAKKEKSPVKPGQVKVTPLARKMMEVNKLDVDDILKGIKKLTSHEVDLVIGKNKTETILPSISDPMGREMVHEPMSQLRKKLSRRLVSVKNETAMLTTFNEVDMSHLLGIRKKYQASFTEKYGVKLGMVSFFARAAAVALLEYPRVNAMIDGDDIVTPRFVDISIAVQTDKGLMVPVIRNAHSMPLPEIEIKISELAQKARTFRLSIEEMTGGTFSITNGGIFGSMLSTPLLNPPQSAILGMHNIVERPVVADGRIEARPVMYVALSYDHRVIDGRDSVSFLVKIKQLIESAESLFLADTGLMQDTGKKNI
jgi:2-oxoglutarate dehydrogenase E2 component (dihydrolipoamide succinyltransferase)